MRQICHGGAVGVAARRWRTVKQTADGFVDVPVALRKHILYVFITGTRRFLYACEYFLFLGSARTTAPGGRPAAVLCAITPGSHPVLRLAPCLGARESGLAADAGAKDLRPTACLPLLAEVSAAGADDFRTRCFNNRTRCGAKIRNVSRGRSRLPDRLKQTQRCLWFRLSSLDKPVARASFRRLPRPSAAVAHTQRGQPVPATVGRTVTVIVVV